MILDVTLTTGVDDITGTSGNDTIIADNSGGTKQLTAADQIDGKAGDDTLKVYNASTDAIDSQSFGTLTNVENIYVNNGTLTNAKTRDISSLTGVTSLEIDSAQAMADSDVFTFKGTSSQSLTLKKLAGTTDAGPTTSTVNLDGITNVTLNAVDTDSTATDSAEITLDLISTDTALNLTTAGAASDLTLANTGAKLAKLTLTGDQALTLGAGLAFAGTSGTVDASDMSGNLTIATTSNDAITFTGGSGKNTVITGSGNDSLTGGASDDTFNAGTGNDTVVGGAGNDNIMVSTGSVNVDAGAGDDAVGVTGLDATDVIKGGDGTDTLGLAFADADAADADTTAGADLRATYSGFEQIRITNDITGALDIAKLGFNYLQIGADVTGGPQTVSGFTNGATVEYRAAADMTTALAVGMTDAALTSDDVVNFKLNADLAAANDFDALFNVNGINTVNVNAVDRVDATATTDNGPDEGYSLTLGTAANLTDLNITGTAMVNYTLSAGTDAIKTIDATESTGNVSIDVSVFAGTERVTIKGSQGVNTIVGDDAAFGEAIIGGAKGDSITAGAGADDITGNGGRDAFILAAAGDSTAASMDQISDFGKVTVATLAADVAAMTNVVTFQATATAKGGADADLLDLAAVATLEGAESGVDVAAATGNAGKTITAAQTAKGVLSVSGADSALVDTLTEWVAVADTVADTAGNVVVFEFEGDSYVFQQGGAVDSVVELTNTTDVNGISLSGVAAAAEAGDIFVLG